MSRHIENVFNSTKGILFDVGWTLFDEDIRLYKTCEWISDNLKGDGIYRPVSVLVEEYTKLCANTHNVNSLTRALLETCGIPKYAVKSLYEHNPWHEFDCPAYSKTSSLLKYLEERGYKLGIVSNQGKHTRELLDKYRLTRYFSTIIISDEVNLRKPDLGIYKLGLKGLGLSATDCTYVGDRIDNDIIPAKKLGMNTIRVLTGPFRYVACDSIIYRNIPEAKPDMCFNSISDFYVNVKKLRVSSKCRKC